MTDKQWLDIRKRALERCGNPPDDGHKDAIPLLSYRGNVFGWCSRAYIEQFESLLSDPVRKANADRVERALDTWSQAVSP